MPGMCLERPRSEPAELQTSRARRAILGVSAATLTLLSGCSLILDFDDKNGDQGPADAGIDAFFIPPALCGAHEDNGTYDQATAITPGTPLEAAICPVVDKDYYTFTIDAASQVTIDATFQVAVGDLDVQLYDNSVFRPELEPVATATSTDDNESIMLELQAATYPNTYVFQVYSKNNAYENIYDVSVTVTPLPQQ